MKINVGFASLLGITFIFLKLAHHIDWSWWWVLSPFWIPFAVAFVIAFCISFWAALPD